MDNLKPLISSKEIEKKVLEMARLVNQEYQNKPVIIVAVLKGSICLLADLMRHLTIPFQIEFVKAKSYGSRGMKSGNLKLSGIEDLDVEGKNLLIVDDIYDTGKTMKAIIELFQTQNPLSVKSLVLLRKKVSPVGRITPDYVCFDIEDHFVVGYGLDYKENYRGLKSIQYIAQ